MSRKDIYAYFCQTEGKIIKEKVTIGDPAPTVCKNNAGHTLVGDVWILKKAPRKKDIGLEEIENIKDNLGGVGDPTVTDDSSSGYQSGSKWINTANDEAWVCVSADVGAAVWKKATENLAGSNVGTSGVGFFKAKDNETFQFKKLNTATDHITITDDTGNDKVDITLNEANIVIGNLSGAPAGSVVGTTDSQTLTNKTWGDNLNMNSNKITNLTTPTADSDAANKSYVDGVAQGIDAKDAVRAKTDSALPAYTQAGAGVGATLTANSSGALPAIDGVTLVADNRVLVDSNGSAADADNGIYVVTQVGDGSNPWILTRATDADDNVSSGMFCFITEGTNSADSGYVLTTNNPITVDTTALNFTQFSGAGQITAGDGLAKTGNTLDVGGSSTIISNTNDLEVNSSATANQVLLSSGTVGTASTFGSVPLNNTNAVTGVLSVVNGGTGAATLTSGKFLEGNGTGAVIYTKAVPSGVVVGTTDTQTLTNKTINTASNTITVATSDISSGTFADARVAASNVTQHEGSINIQNLAGAPTGTIVGTSDTQTLTNKTISTASNTISVAASDVSSGTFANSRIAESNITQHEAALTINNMIGAPTGAIVGISDAQTLTNKTINTASNTLVVAAGDVTTGTFANARIASSNVTQHEGSVNISNLSGAPTGTVVGTTDTQTLTNKTLTSAVLTTPQINDTSANHQYVFGVNELVADRTVTLPLLTGNDEFTFNSHTQTLTNKTINTASNTISVAASDVSSGTFSNSRITASNITQHESSININNLSGAPSGAVVGSTDSQTLTNKTLTSAVLTTPQINDTSANHQYVFGVNELVADRTVTLPLLGGNDEFTFNNHSQILTNKTINTASNTITVSTSDVSSGTFADARIAASNVTQHEGSVNIQNLSGAPAGTVVGTSDAQTLTNKTINTASNTITVAASDVGSGTFADARVAASNVTQHEGSINHDNLTGFVGNEHINHSTVSITAGEGLTGGGNITTNRTIDLDINGLTADATPDGAADYVVTYDASATAHKKVLLNNLPGGGGGGGETVGYFHAYTSAAGTNFTTVPTVVNFNTEAISSSDWTLASGILTAQTADDFLFIVDVGTEGSSGTSRSGCDAYIEADTGGGYAEITGTRGLMYNRGSTYGDNSATICRPITVSTGDKFRVMTVRHHGSDTLKTRANSCRITIVKVKGETGPAGTAGADGDMTWEGAWVSQNYLQNQAVQYQGSAYVCHTNTVGNEVPTNTSYWDLLASKGDQGTQGIQGIQGATGLIDWQGVWVSQNYTADQSVSYNGESYICILNTVSNENPSNATYWDKIAEKGSAGPAGSGSTINVYSDGIAVTGTPFEKINIVGTTKAEQNGGDSTMVDVYVGVSHYGASATDPTGSFNAGDKYFNTVLNEEMFYDGSRSKWLSVAIRFEGSGLNGSTPAGTFYRRFNGMSLAAATGPYVPKGTIVEIGFGTASAVAHTYEILVGGVVTAELASGGAAEAFSRTINADFNGGKMSSRNKAGSGTTSNFQGTVGYRLRI